jgi:xanthine dehydrogenase small subunit
MMAKHGDARLAAATTDLGVVHNKGKIRLAKLVSLHAIPELYRIQTAKGRVSVGARVTLTELRTYLKEKHPEFSRFLDLFASPQIKNVATLIGNVGNASPIADTPPFLLATNAVVKVAGTRGVRRIGLDAYYLGYRKTALKKGELIASIEFDLPVKHESLALYKVSQRKDLDISGVNAAFRVKWDGAGRKRALDVRIAMGGVAATPLRLRKTEKFLQGKALSPEVFVAMASILKSEMAPLSDLRGTSTFRRVVVENLLARFFREHRIGASK